MRPEAYHGLAGEIVEALSPETEADPAGLLVTLLAAFGAAVGPGPHAVADGAPHPPSLDVVLVGRSSRARKGTSWANIRQVLELADASFVSGRVIGGLASGEGLVSELAARPVGLDRSVLVMEPEYARLLRVGARSATLSALLRELWDGTEVAVRTRRDPLRASGVNVSILGHITAEELRRRLDGTEVANGFGNRMLYIWVERAQRLPGGGSVPPDTLGSLAARLRNAIERARGIGRLTRSPEAEELWAGIYNSIDDDVEGVVGALTARAEAQLLRLSVALALLDGSDTIEATHLRASVAIWEHCEATVRRVFAPTVADPVTSRLLAALEEAGHRGLDGTEQRDLFARHVAGTRLAAARAELERRGIAATTRLVTGGRPRLVTRAFSGGSPQPWSLSSPAWTCDSSPPDPLWITRGLASDNGCVSEVSEP